MKTGWSFKKYFILFVLIIFSPRLAHADIIIAAIGPLTGQDAITGEQMQRGAEAAISDINDHGSILGQKIKLLLKDDADDPKQAVAVANELAGENVFAVIGPMSSGPAIPAAKIFSEEGIIMVSPSATNPSLTDQGLEGIFRTCGRDDQQGQTIADYVHQNLSDKSMALIHDKTAYGQGLADVVAKDLHKAHIYEKLYESINRGERDYGALLSKLKENNIDVVFFGGYHTEAGLIVRQMRDQGMKTIFIGGDDLTTQEFWSITGNAGEGSLMSFNTDPRTRPEASEAVQRLRAAGFDPEGTTMYTYAAIQVITEALKRTGNTDVTKVISTLHHGSYPTVIGDISFDAKGDVEKPDYIMYRWSQGAYAPIERQ